MSAATPVPTPSSGVTAPPPHHRPNHRPNHRRPPPQPPPPSLPDPENPIRPATATVVTTGPIFSRSITPIECHVPPIMDSLRGGRLKLSLLLIAADNRRWRPPGCGGCGGGGGRGGGRGYAPTLEQCSNALIFRQSPPDDRSAMKAVLAAVTSQRQSCCTTSVSRRCHCM